MRHHLFVIAASGVALLATNVAAQSASCQLASTLRTTYGGGGTVSFYTTYSYDNDGNRVSGTVYEGTDETGTAMSTTEYTYDADGRLTSEVLKAGAVTMASVTYSYDIDGNLVETRTLNGAGETRYYDSLVYDVDGNCIRENHYTSAGEKTYYRALSYNTEGLKASDTLFEDDSQGGYEAKQATLFTYTADGKVSAEANWREQSGWYLISTVRMAYESGNLVSATEYEGDGSSMRMMDSLAFESDEHGNRTREARYDDERTLLHTIDYTWECTVDVIACGRNAVREDGMVAARGGMLQISGLRGPVQVAIYDMGGRLVQRHETSLAGGPISIAAPGHGSWVARVNAGGRMHSVRLTALN